MRYISLIILAMWVLPLQAQKSFRDKLIRDTRQAVIARAQRVISELPVTITAYSSARSAGDKHDFYSEGDYWWPDPADPKAPYIQRDGQSNPDNFTAHREAMIRLSRIMGALAAGYVAGGDKTYLQRALVHARAWFVDTATSMRPALLYAQAIKGRVTGRGIGIIDTIHLLEVVEALRIMEKAGIIPRDDLAAMKAWFTAYLQWMTTHPYGKDEMNATNNHGTCWVMQVASFARFTGNKTWTDFCIQRYETVLLPAQMAADGSFPQELKRTKPYGYSLFNLDAMSTICQLLSTPAHNLWQYTTNQQQNIALGMAFMYPYVQQKNSWPYGADVMYWNQWPVAQPFLVFGAAALDKEDYYRLWLSLEHDPQEPEVLRNLPVRNPLIWF
ncbi:alginate lyase family protein [Chitinophaga nivalis]|uniref:Alginate lyase family protein n=1 Tax=Chitinophaga nivalis TaxID=2991709 RepID=A0ABT3IEM2_9BACT|nr:alginate lyase family protein [Chitinophaga nivalis]MCW3467963.1 alginate lyase family protein [Chitinophaga nivalis]MCW3482346.1 alginate lyase family protein [Chitinophaga nivalis]